jgi:hypothetical protein
MKTLLVLLALLLILTGCRRATVAPLPAPAPLSIPAGFTGVLLHATIEPAYKGLDLPFQRAIVSACNAGPTSRDIDTPEALQYLAIHPVSAAYGNAVLAMAHTQNGLVRASQDLTQLGSGGTIAAAFTKALTHAVPWIALGTTLAASTATIIASRAPNQPSLSVTDPKPSYKLAAHNTEGYCASVEVYVSATDHEAGALLP